LQYTTETRLIRLMCTGRMDLKFVFQAFSNRMDGVIIAGCHLNECNYITHGNYHALNMVLLSKKILEHIGLNSERLRLEFVTSGEGIRFAEVMNEFGKKVGELGPLGKSEGIDENTLKLRLTAVKRLVPYLRLVERERLRVHFATAEEYKQFYASEQLDRLFHELIADKIALSEIMLLLKEKPLSTGEISEVLGFTPSEVSKHIKSTTRQGLVRFDERQKRFAPV
jgi:F420-non-reducing hydrogenase iron-sulfur subunit